MKNKISVLFLLFIVINGYAQQPKKGNKNEPIIIYDTISVYDTVVVYDTIKVYDKTFSQNLNVVENATLTIDAASKKTSLSLFFENDTATISINSIHLSENTKNLDTMKKEILTLMAAVTLTQTAKSQDSLSLITNTKKPYPAYTISVGNIIATSGGPETNSTYYGINLSADKMFGKKPKIKMILGLTTILAPVSIETTNAQTGTNTKSNGNLYSILFTFRYYLFIKESSKIQLYSKSGAGFALFTNVPPVVGYKNIGTEKNYKGMGASVQMLMGVELKLTKTGHLFSELGIHLASFPYTVLNIGYKFNF